MPTQPEPGTETAGATALGRQEGDARSGASRRARDAPSAGLAAFRFESSERDEQFSDGVIVFEGVS